MSRPDSNATYRKLLRLPGVPRAFTFATLGRLSYGTLPLSLLFTIQHATGSFGAAGASMSAFGVASLAMPAKARVIDRSGQARALCLLGVGYSLVLSGTCALALLAAGGATGYIILAGAAGLLAPPLGPSMRGLWAALTATPALRQRAYSLDAVVEETLYVTGPSFVGAILAVAGPVVALAVTAALVLIGTVALVTSPAVRMHGAPALSQLSSARRTPLRHPGFQLVLTGVLVVGAGIAAVELGVAARANADGARTAAGYLLAGLSLGSVLGGLAWGRICHRTRPARQLTALLSMLGISVALPRPHPTWLSSASFSLSRG
jgi:hypothetical protein